MLCRFDRKVFWGLGTGAMAVALHGAVGIEGPVMRYHTTRFDTFLKQMGTGHEVLFMLPCQQSHSSQ